MQFNTNSIRISLDICNYCNLQCQYCSARMPYINHNIVKEITLKNIEVILYYVNKYFKDFDIIYSIKGGEPTLYPHIADMLNIIYYKTHKLSQIILDTNNTVPLYSIRIDFSKIHCLITYHFSQIYNTKKSDIFLENIKFLCDNKYSHEVIILTDKSIIDFSKVNDIYNTIKQMNHKTKVVSAYPVHQYTDERFDYTKVDNTYNLQYDKEVYYMRTFKIDYNLLCSYLCNLAVNEPLYNRKIIYPAVWQLLHNNINKKTICDYAFCACPNLCFTVEEEEII